MVTISTVPEGVFSSVVLSTNARVLEYEV